MLKVLVISIAINYIFSAYICKCKWKRIFITIPILVNVGLLLYFKYTDFAISNINFWFDLEIEPLELALPVGISFFTFQQIAYLIAVYHGMINATVVDYLVYILYFPKILMGPLADPVDFYAQLNDENFKKVNWEHVASGIKLFSFGLFKKMLLADTFAGAVSWGYENMDIATSMDWILIMLSYTFEIYFDFSGYSDMALGSSMMFNITLPINFDSPYKAISIRDFWKRWHISLTTFFTKYIYIPLGGSRKGIVFTCINTMIVFLVSGLWHGANWTFILWGALHGLFSIVDRLCDKWEKKIFEPVRWLMTFSVINVLWLLFCSDSIAQWKKIMKTILYLQNTGTQEGLLNMFSVGSLLENLIMKVPLINGVRGMGMLLFLFVAFFICLIPKNNYQNREKLLPIGMMLAAVAFAWGVMCLGSESVFVYYGF